MPGNTQAPQAQTQNGKSNPVETARQRLQQVESLLNRLVVGREDAIRAVMLALVAREHAVMIGPPGTAKSYLVLSLSRLIQARFYAYLMTRYTTYDELFGPVDISALAQSGELRRRWSAIISSDIVFLDEIFKASSAILNALLSLMQERVVYDPISGQAVQTKLWSLIAASNETPLDEELQALYDRFAVRVFISYLDDDAKLLSALIARWQQNGSIQPAASMDDVRALHEYAIALLSRGKIKDLGEVIKLYHVNMVPLVKTLRAKGVIVSDRSIVEKLPKLYASYLALYGVTADNIVNAVYDIILFSARTPQELADIRKAIDESLGEVAELSRRLEQGKQMLRAGNLQAALEAFREVAAYDVSRLAAKPWLKPRVEALIRVAQEYVRRTEEIIQQIRALQEAA
jgi:MoxR-like ATPase